VIVRGGVRGAVPLLRGAGPRRGSDLPGRGSLGVGDEAIGLILGHLAAPYHELDEFAGALDGEASQSGGGGDHVTHGARHPVVGLLADLMRSRGELGQRFTRIRGAVSRRPPRGRRGGLSRTAGVRFC